MGGCGRTSWRSHPGWGRDPSAPARVGVPLSGSSSPLLVEPPPCSSMGDQGVSGTRHPHRAPTTTAAPGVRGQGVQGVVGLRGHQAALPRTSTLMRKTMRKKTHMKNRSITLATFFHSPFRRWEAR